MTLLDAYKEIMRDPRGDYFFYYSSSPVIGNKFDNELNEDIIFMQLMGFL